MKRPVYAVLLLSVAGGLALGFGQSVELSSNRAAEVDAVLIKDCMAKHDATNGPPMSQGQVEAICREAMVAQRDARRHRPSSA